MTTEPGQFAHWHIERDAENIVWLALDRQGEKTNSLSEAVIRELGDIVSALEADTPAGLVISSAKELSLIHI